MNKIKLIYKVTRPMFSFFIALIYTLGAIYSGFNFELNYRFFIFILNFIILWFPLSVFLYGINDIYDYDTDKLNDLKKNGYGDILKRQDHKFILKASFLSALLVIFSTFLTFSIEYFFLVLILLIISYLYSAPPIRLKNKPILDSLSNGLIYFVIPFLLGYTLEKSIVIFNNWYDLILIGFCFAGLHAFAAARDYESDKKAGEKTIATMLGRKKTILLVIFLYIFIIISDEIESILVNIMLIYSTFVFIINYFIYNKLLIKLSGYFSLIVFLSLFLIYLI